jgi:UDPglucose 6-dehydrogenase
MVGTGYVGLVSGACFADFGHTVTCVDINEKRIQGLERGEIPFYEPGLDELVRRNRSAGRLHFTTFLSEGMRDADVAMIAVQTPSGERGEADLTYVLGVAREIGRELRAGVYTVIVTKSTVPVGSSMQVASAVRDVIAPGARFDVASNPEFLREGSAIEDFMRPNRVVLGVESDEAADVMSELYRPLFLLETPILVCDIATSELIKYASNAFLAVKISYINELSDLCEKVGADVAMVAKGMGLDQRIGRKFLHAGLGFGGSCLPKDTRAIVNMASENGEDLALVDAAMAANARRVERALVKLDALCGGLSGKTVALLGLAFKPNTDDIREAPALGLVAGLRAAGASVRGCDPEAAENFAAAVEDMEIATDPYSCAAGADAVMLVTEWNPYRELDLARLRDEMSNPVFMDCRNVYDRGRMESLGFRYDCFGR